MIYIFVLRIVSSTPIRGTRKGSESDVEIGGYSSPVSGKDQCPEKIKSSVAGKFRFGYYRASL